jgi:hypothetical protein
MSEEVQTEGDTPCYLSFCLVSIPFVLSKVTLPSVEEPVNEPIVAVYVYGTKRARAMV